MNFGPTQLGISCLSICAALLLGGCQAASDDDTALIAVATNFRTTFETLETAFERDTDFNVTQVSGATGSLYTQIINGAPYHIFLSADQARPKKLEADDRASDRFTYAQGTLVLWSYSEDILNAPLEDILAGPHAAPLSMANPALAPYGRAAQEVLDAVSAPLNQRIVMGENAGQAFALVGSRNAAAGFVAKSDAMRSGDGYTLEIDSALYRPIKQDAVLLRTGENLPSAKAFFAFLQSEAAREIIAADGYSAPKENL